MLCALILDWLGQLLILALILSLPALTGIDLGGESLQGQRPWVVFVLLLYPLLGWLFGSYTVLRWRCLAFPVLLQRLLITATATLMVVAIARWLLNPGDEVWLVYRRVQLLWIGHSRYGHGRTCRSAPGILLPEAPKMLRSQSPRSWRRVLRAWQRVPRRQRLRPVKARPSFTSSTRLRSRSCWPSALRYFRPQSCDPCLPA